MAKLPAIQFYPGDWRKDMGVQSLSFHDRGVWFEILMLMHESEQRGVLILNGRPMPEESLCRVLGLDNQILTTTLTNLLTSGVASREQETGALLCRRMVRDEKIRQIRTEAGSKGGNPVLLNQKPTTGDKQIPTPSSSTSSSITKPLAREPRTVPKPSKEPTLFKQVQDSVFQAYSNKNGVMPEWDGSEGKALSLLLAANPSADLAHWRRCIQGWADSELNHGDRPRIWLPRLSSYRNPLNAYNRPKDQETTHGPNRKHLNPQLDRQQRGYDAILHSFLESARDGEAAEPHAENPSIVPKSGGDVSHGRTLEGRLDWDRS